MFIFVDILFGFVYLVLLMKKINVNVGFLRIYWYYFVVFKIYYSNIYVNNLLEVIDIFWNFYFIEIYVNVGGFKIYWYFEF